MWGVSMPIGEMGFKKYSIIYENDGIRYRYVYRALLTLESFSFGCFSLTEGNQLTESMPFDSGSSSSSSSSFDESASFSKAIRRQAEVIPL